MKQENELTEPSWQFGTGVIIEPGAKVGKHVTIGHYSVIHSNVVIRDYVTIGSHCVLGVLPSGNQMMRQTNQNLEPLVLESNIRIGNYVTLYAGTVIGTNTFLGDYANIRENVRIGSDSVIGRMASVELNTSIGSHCVVQTLAYITADTVIEDDVFIGPCVSMSNDKYMGLSSDPMRGPTIRSGARIGNNASLLPNVQVGTGSIVGAGSVVTKDVPPGKTVIGVPAHELIHPKVQGRINND